METVLEIFNVKNLGEFGEIIEDELPKISDCLSKIEKKILTYIENKEKENIILNFYTILLFFNYRFYKDKEKYDEMFKNNNTKKYLSKILLNNINEDLFKEISFTQTQITELIIGCDNLDFSELIKILKYNNDFLIILNILNGNKDLFLKKYNDKKENKNNFINLDLLVNPKKDDDINAIIKQIEELISFQKEKNTFFVKITPSLLKLYVDIYQNDSLDKLFSLKDLIINLRKVDNKFYNIKIEEIIHNNIISLSQKKKLNNIELLNFIEKDTYYKDKQYLNSDNRTVDILSGIDIATVNEEFLKKWKELKFFEIFKNKKDLFIDKVCSLINDMNHFNYLFILLNQSKEDNEKTYDECTIKKMQEKYLEFLKLTDSPEKCDDVVDLIYYSGENNINSKNFNENIQNNLKIDIVNNIYKKLVLKYEYISEDLFKIIIEFFTNKSLKNDPLKLSEVIKECKKLRKYILSNMINYIITENDIYKNEDTDNFNLLVTLIKDGIFNENSLKKIQYILKSNSVIKTIFDNISNNNINYSLANIIFQNKLDNKITERLSSISKNNEDVITLCLGLKNSYLETKTAVDYFELCLRYFNFFYENKLKDKIIELIDIINKIKTANISTFFQDYKNKYTEYLNIYGEEIKKNKILLDSKFFVNIYKHFRKKNDINDDNFYVESLNEFEKLKKLFEKKTIIKLMKELELEICLKNFNLENIEKQLSDELEIIANYFKIEKNKNYDKNLIISKLKIILNKEIVLNLANSIKLFVDFSNVNKTKFYTMIEKIIEKSCNNKKYISFIEKNQNIDILLNIENQSTNEILIKLKDQPDSINFLFNSNIDTSLELNELPLLSENIFLTRNDILAFEKCIEFIKNLRKDVTTDQELITNFRKKIAEDENMLLYFDKYVNNYGEIKELLERNLKNPDNVKKKIKYICDNSQFILTNDKDNQKGFFSCQYQDEKRHLFELKYENFLELRDIAQLSKINSEDEKERELYQNCQKVIKIAYEIKNIYKIIVDIYNKGYPKQITISLNLDKDGIKYKFINEKLKSYEELITKIKTILDKCKEAEINAYINKPLIRFFYGQQLNLLYKSIINKNKKNEINPFLQYFTNNLINENFKNNYKYQKKKEDLLEDLFINCEDFLKYILLNNQLTLENIYQRSLISNDNIEYKGVYIYYWNELEKQIFQIYKYLTSNIPSAQNILICHEETLRNNFIFI